MATRFLTALDYSDWHTSTVLRKHAKKRPLGELESRYQYTPPQPVLSCRTVDIDVSGTRTYRPRSTTDILDEQQKLIHKLFTGSGRAAASAPPRRVTPRKGLGQVTNGVVTPSPTPTPTPPTTTAKGKSTYIHVQGRPCTSMSQTSDIPVRQKLTPTGQRPKTTGRLKNVKSATDSFLAQDYAEDMLETRRSHSELTNQIHAHWRPESCNLNQGHFMRGQKRPDDVPPTLDAWLTFGGAANAAEESGGVVDAFANFQSVEDYYNIEGSVGSRVAEQLQKGDRIRIGINGEIFSHDLKVKKWVKGEHSPGRRRSDRQEEEEEKEEKGQEELKEEGREEERVEEEKEEEEGPAASTPKEKLQLVTEAEDKMFGDMTFDSLDNVMEKEVTAREESEARENGENAPKRPGSNKILLDFPLSWDDQISRPEVKVISARSTPRDSARENLCETHPVVFNRVVRTTSQRPKLASAVATNGYHLKQRALGNTRLDSVTSSKVKTISFDHSSPEDEERLSSMSVEDVIQKRLEKNTSTPIPGAESKTKLKNGVKRPQEEESSDSADVLPKVGGQKILEKPFKRSVSAISKTSTKSFGESTSLDGRSGKAFSSSSSAKPLAVPRPSSSVPSRGARDMDLGIVAPSALITRKVENQNSEKGARHVAALPLYRSLGNGVSSINAGPIPGDTEFIQISQPIRNPNSIASVSSGMRSHYSVHPMNSIASTPFPPPVSPPRSNTPENGMGGHSGMGTPRTITPKSQRSLAGSPNLNEEQGQNDHPSTSPDLNMGGSGMAPDVVSQNGHRSPVSEPAGSDSSSNAKAINIPTGDNLEEDEEEELTTAQRRERTLRDQHIEQIADLLEGAIVSGDHQ